MRVPLSWLRDFVDINESPEELRAVLDDLGLVVEGIERIGEGLEDVVVARIDEVRAIEGADRVRLVVVDAGAGPLEIVCGATNFEVGDHVPLAPIGAVLPGGFEIARRTMRGVVSNGMLCSARELGLSDDHVGLMILDETVAEPSVGVGLMETLDIEPDVVFDISVEGNRPDAWSIMGVARDLATRFERELRAAHVNVPNSDVVSAQVATARIDAPELCGRLTVSVLRNVVVAPSPPWVQRRIRAAGMRPISNVVDASNLVMLELGQPTHPYDADRVARRTIGVRRARTGETLETLDGVQRQLATPGRGLGDTGVDCVIVDGDDHVIGLAGIMGGATSEISDATSEVLLEAAFFDPMAIARSSKRHGLRSEASNRFERGVDPELALRAAGRFVAVLAESVPDLEWLAQPLDVRGDVPEVPTIELRPGDVERALGQGIDDDVVTSILTGLGFSVVERDGALRVSAPSGRLDVRTGAAGRADVIEEIARLYGYRRLARRVPTWPEPGSLNARQHLRRRVRDIVVDLGADEAWTPTLGSDADFDVVSPGTPRVRITNPLASDESVLRATMITGLVRAWGKNVERATGDVILAELGMVFSHPDAHASARVTKGGAGGAVGLSLPFENERLSVILGRRDDDATTAVAFWSTLAGRLGLDDVVVRSRSDAPGGWHPTRCADLVDRASGAVLGLVGEADPNLIDAVAPGGAGRRLGVIDLDLDVVANEDLATRAPVTVAVPSKYPSATVDLAFVTPDDVHAQDLAQVLRAGSSLVEDVVLFDVFRGTTLPASTRSLAYSVRFSSPDRTLNEAEVAGARETLISAAHDLGARLR